MGKGGHYLFSLKAKQKNLLDDVTRYFEKASLEALKYCSNYDKGNARVEVRKCSVSQDSQWLILNTPNGRSIKSITRIESAREIKGKCSSEAR
ncbi:hypothetical protein [Holospora curviuscula]|uniref:Uncharacterized protein n=1 Tax=Holospora curviuscula TaxID=1082868 RepID=A0A2S5RE65_9PROT|nr:hypothetical protein [Holospora curviuscula]PPE05600.1 hypothetical protein HCUR_00248 [Holospora curviuscula]